MASLIPQDFIGAEKILANYSYSDVSDGTGYIIYYGFAHTETTNTSYALTTQSSMMSSAVFTTGATTTPISKIADIDFDLIFNRPQRIKGKVRATFVFGAAETGTASTEGTAYVTIKLRKWDGSTETEIASATSATLTFPAQTATWQKNNVEIDVSTIAAFKAGETMRVTMELYGADNTNQRTIKFYHSPDNEDDPNESGVSETYPTKFMIHIPYLLNI